MASPSGIRKRLAREYPDVQRVFRELQQTTGSQGQDDASQVTNVWYSWSSQSFRINAPGPLKTVSEGKFREIVSLDKLLALMGPELETEFREWK